MARIRNEEWLHHAKRLAVGQQARVKHGNERTDAMTVGNREDRWWAYCQRCKCGSVEMKSHVLLGMSGPPPESANLTKPFDAVPIHALAQYEVAHIAGLLARKHMDLMYFANVPVTWSRQRQRLLLSTPSGLMGRDTTERSEQKWLTYDRQHWITDQLDATLPNVVLVEDCFSWAKVSYARSLYNLPVSVFCTLGTAIHDNLFLHLLRHAKQVASFYDGDSAGWLGCVRNEQRLFGVGLSSRDGYNTQFTQCAPVGMDPKDMDLLAIKAHVQGVFAIQ